MQFTQPDYDIDNVQKLANLVKDQATAVKLTFDKTGKDTKDFLIALIAELESIADGSSGADKIGTTSIPDLNGNTVQAILESFKTKFDGHKNSADHDERYYTQIVVDMLIEAATETLNAELDGHKNSADHDTRYYTQQAVDILIDAYKNEANGKFETMTDLTNNRKLSPAGNFTGTWNGMQPTASDPGLAATVNAHLADNVQQFSEVIHIDQQITDNLRFLANGHGSINLIGDSITAGTGSTSYANHYVTKLYKKLYGLYDIDNSYDCIVDFSSISDFAYTGCSYGTKGIGKSLIMAVNATIITNRQAGTICIYHYKEAAQGSIEIYKNDVLITTFDCSTGTDTYDELKFYNIPNEPGEIKIKCINASVELTGVLLFTNGNNSMGNITVNRFAISGTNTTDYTSASKLASILKIGSFYNSKRNIFIIALGTNDIYAATKANSVATYKANIKTIAEYLKVNNQIPILFVPPKANEGTWPPIITYYTSYKDAIYELAYELELQVIDMSQFDFVASGWYSDGVHPNNTGHDEYFKLIYRSLLMTNNKIDKPFPKLETPYRVTYQNGWVDFNVPLNSYVEYYKDNLGVVTIQGLCKSGTATANTTIFDLPVGYRPTGADKFIPVITSTGIGYVTISATTGAVKIQSGGNGWLSFDGVSFRI